MNTETMDTDKLLKLLRAAAKFGGHYKDAADTIDALKAEVARLRPCAEVIVEAALHGLWAGRPAEVEMALKALNPLLAAPPQQPEGDTERDDTTAFDGGRLG